MAYRAVCDLTHAYLRPSCGILSLNSTCTTRAGNITPLILAFAGQVVLDGMLEALAAISPTRGLSSSCVYSDFSWNLFDFAGTQGIRCSKTDSHWKMQQYGSPLVVTLQAAQLEDMHAGANTVREAIEVGIPRDFSHDALEWHLESATMETRVGTWCIGGSLKSEKAAPVQWARIIHLS